MKIALYTPSLPPKGGGIATAHYNLCRLLRGQFDVKAFVFNEVVDAETGDIMRRRCPPLAGVLARRAMTMYLRRLDKKADLSNCLRIATTACAVIRMNRALQQFAPDIVLVPDNGVPAYFLRKPVNAKLLWFAHNFYPRFRKNPLVTHYSPVDLDVASSMERKAIRKADAIIAPSSHMAREMKAAFAVDRPVRVINNFLFREELEAIEAFPLRRHLGVGEDIPLVYVPSAGSDNKGRRYLLEMIRRVSERVGNQLAFYLSGPVASDLEFELASLKRRVAIYSPGHVTWSQNLSMVKACDLTVSPTLIENFSNALLEALCIGKPCVTFDTGGNNEIVDHGMNGYIAAYIDVDDLVEKAVGLIVDGDLRKRFGQEAAKRGAYFCDTKRILTQYKTLFDEVVSKRAGV